MSDSKDVILIIDDQEINRKIIVKQLSDSFHVLQASNGQEGIDILLKDDSVGVIILDWLMPVMNGLQFLTRLKEIGKTTIPVIVMTGDPDVNVEETALKSGALDFITKPVNQRVLRSRVDNALARNELVLLKRMEFNATHDSLTNLYNRTKMFAETHKMLIEHPDIQFAFIRFDIVKFRLYNSAMGEREGDNLLHFIASGIEKMASEFSMCTYGRIDADIFCMCEPYDKDIIMNHVKTVEKELSDYRKDYTLVPTFGIYVIDNPCTSLETLFTRASMASDKCKNLYDTRYAFYEPSMSDKVLAEQQITNEMQHALETNQFLVYLQPKYDISTDKPCGAEALVRWKHPDRGLIPPDDFIPVFEKNGFIATLDYYMWEHVCQLLSRWKKEGRVLLPISVNMSRVSMFNQKIDVLIEDLVKKYDIPPAILNLEVTENVYMSNPRMMNETIDRLRSHGFIILMDDFGKGYSSLNTLKDMNIDILKLDMKFMPNGENNSKSEKIISSIVRMAGWLGMEVVAEGVETLEQKEFLKSVGCGYVQGYYYAKPMPIETFEQLIDESDIANIETLHSQANNGEETLWHSNAVVGELISGIDVPVAIIEYSNAGYSPIRLNKAYIEKYGNKMIGVNNSIIPEDRLSIQELFKTCSLTGSTGECEFSYLKEDGQFCYIRINVQKVGSIPQASIMSCIFEDISKEKTYENKLLKFIDKYDNYENKKKLLIVDDQEISRAILKNLFTKKFEILEAANGKEALEILKNDDNEIAAILLDIIMPVMDGKEFIHQKNSIVGKEDIPVIVISAEKDSAMELGMLENGVNDYITKPFDSKITFQRVINAISYQSRFKELVKEYKKAMGEIS